MGAREGNPARFLIAGKRLPAFREAVYKKAKREKLLWRALSRNQAHRDFGAS